MTSQPTLKYRADIDGLRALAVLAVLFFHGGSSLFSGGFVGVDIFFVISGYLITAIIDKKVKEGTFSYREFWLKRVRRIFPASFVCVIASVFIFSYLLSPADFKIFGKSLLSLGLFSSNIYFWRETGYFSQNAEEFPLLHTWSLSVEEQFYFFLPLTLIFLEKFTRKKKVIVLAGLVFLSFVGCVMLTQRSPAASFYLLPTRAWELGLGSLLALGPIHRFKKVGDNPVVFHLFCFLSLGLMIVPMFCFDKETTFPSYNALYPVLGATLFIALPNLNSGFKKIFFNPLVLLVGKISYSLYLWHWIIFVALKHMSIVHPTSSQYFIGGVVSFILAGLSFLFVEEPVRRNVEFWDNKKLWVFLAINTLVFIVVGLVSMKTDGLPQRFSGDFVDHKAQVKIPKTSEYCIKRTGVVCRGNEQGGKGVFLWGDSHAQSFLELFKKMSQKKGINFFFAIKEGCPPLMDVFVSGQTHIWNESCQEHTRKVLSFLEEFNGKIFISFRYDLYFNNRRAYEKTFMPERFLLGHSSEDFDKKSSLENLKLGFSKVIAKLRGKDVVVLRQVPAFDFNPAHTLNKIQILNKKIDLSESRKNLEERVFSFESHISVSGVGLFDTWPYFCNDSKCSPLSSSKPSGERLMYYDDDHLNVLGAQRLQKDLNLMLF